MTPIRYPHTRKADQIDNYHGRDIADPFRWLEVDTAPEVEKWVDAQNEVTFQYLEQIPERESIRKRLRELLDYERLSSPFRAGDYYFFYKNDGLQNQPVIYFQKGLEGDPEVFIDPNSRSEDGTIAVTLLGFSQDDRYVAYAQSEAGSDWQQIRVMEVATKKELPNVLKWVKFSGAAWHEDGFFYSRYPQPDAGSEYSAKNLHHTVYYHRLGTDQSEDQLIYRDEDHPTFNHYCTVTEDGQYLLIYASPGTDGYATYFKDLKQDGPITRLFAGYSNKSSVVDHRDGKFLVMTDLGAPKYRLLSVPAKEEVPENEWQELIPETDDLLQGVNTGGGYLFANYLKNATNRIYRLNYDGSGRQEIELPGPGNAGGFSGKKEEKILFYTFTSFIYPTTIFKYDIGTGSSEPFFRAELQFNPEDYTEKQVFYTSKDGTKVSMFIVHKKGLQMDGQNPCYLYGYGGFNISLSPGFSASRVVLLERGGILAIPNLRGGGEYGEEWHQGGMLANKQNVFDDFIAAAEYLIDQGYTAPSRLAIAGGSNGGLLVGAAMTQRPELFAVAFPSVGVLDMLRFHLFTIGRAWVPEYGSSDDPQQFPFLLAYSPLHNLQDGKAYPATLITTADHDDRVVPAHSFKFAARLQEAQDGAEPVLIRISKRAGHGAGKPIAKVIEEQADIWSFFFHNTRR
ncbi:prolyl oligopeptidase family serine peptidase [Flavilitoribacter nigricans]|uniref:prolyl oligopeptidase n=1 Tax=Flavilitoribacter nigricans (strain ATCC 23147 / DSM 23189 / NBRC 102662 / NCIMB 1420 / SS-2) TaxID=1122177 RepID=A0A2D0MZ35_FLAN2|nr:prolyl oligopeptidase family serine peptidase [Flavilitoribacter nigricans]PHN01541.1 S9 family peptidase [Flavilitoribacter nigricans DSM 23189 = NBRC 102662]